MKTLIQTLLIGLSVIASACNVEVAELREPAPEVAQAEVIPEETEESPYTELPNMLKASIVLSGHCMAFAVGPRTIMSAAHCVGTVGTNTIAHPVTGSRIPLNVLRVEYNAGHFDRAILVLPEGSPNLKYWFEIGDPIENDVAIVVGKRNQHYLPVVVESKREDNVWVLRSVTGEDVYPGDSGSPVVSVTTGKVIGVLSHFGPMITPITGF